MSHMELGFGAGGEEVGETAMANFVHVIYFSYWWYDKQEKKYTKKCFSLFVYKCI